MKNAVTISKRASIMYIFSVSSLIPAYSNGDSQFAHVNFAIYGDLCNEISYYFYDDYFRLRKNI